MPPRPITRDRAISIAGVALIHAALGYALLRGLGYAPPIAPLENLTVFDVAPEPPPPPPVIPDVAPAKNKEPRPDRPEGAASPPNLRDTPTPVVVPPPVIRLELPTPIVAAPIAGTGNRPSAGAADVPGPGTGAGGIGTGLGSGASGDGTGGGGGGGSGRRARQIRGAIYDRDDPGERRVGGGSDVVYLRFVVDTDGRVRDCAVTRSSGYPSLDAVTCRLIRQRFRYRPAENGNGEPIRATIQGQHEWERAAEREPIDVEPTILDE